MWCLLVPLFPLAMASEDLNRVSDGVSWPGTTLSTGTGPSLSSKGPGPLDEAGGHCECSVPNLTDHRLEHAKLMKAEIRNRTTLLQKIRHRTTHSVDAVWASLSLTCIVVLLTLGVLQSKMWAHRPHVSTMDSQPVRFIQYNSQAEIRVKELLRSRGRSLLDLFSRRRRIQAGRVRASTGSRCSLRMESFLGVTDTVDSSHRALILSSSSEEEDWDWPCDQDKDQEVVFQINRDTGEWEGTPEETLQLLGGRQATRSRRRRRRRGSSSSSYSSLTLDPAVAKDLVRLSSEEEFPAEELMVKIG